MSKKFSIAIGAALAALLVASVAAVAAVSAGNTGWFWGNPLPQGNTLSTIDSVGTRVYSAGDTGTLLRSDDAGASWIAVRTGLLDNIRLVRAVGPDTVVFAGACALRRSDDGGATVKRLTWGPNDESCSVKIRSFSFPAANVGFLLLENGDVFTTADGGDSWSKKTAMPGSTAAGGGVAVGDIWFTSASTGVASVGSAIFQTTDGATSWTPVGPALASTSTIGQFSFSSATNGFAVGGDATVLQTTDGGTTWLAPVGNNAAAAAGAGSTLRNVDCFDANTCIATNDKGSQLIRTADAGVTWAAVSPTSNGVWAAAHTSVAGVVAVGGLGTTVLSSDQGVTWNAVSSAASGTFNRLRAQSATTAFAFGPGGALARTTNGGNSWTPIGASTSNEILDVAFPSANRGFVLDSAGVVLRTNNGGASWQFLDTGTTAAPNAMVAPNDGTVILIGPRGVRRSTDGGDSFAAVGNKSFKKAALYGVDVAGGAYFATSGRTVFGSTNQGKTWTRLQLPKKVSSYRDLDMVTSKAGYLLDGKNELWVTRNNGKKWTRIETTGAGFAASIAFGDMAHGYVTDDTGRILYTGDAGKTWSRQYPFYDQNGDSFLTIDAPTGAAAFMLVRDTNKLFATTTNGQIGKASSLTIKSSSKKVRRNTVIKVTGKLSPNSGGERVTILARAVGAKNGTRWTQQERTVAANGTFTTSWKIKKPTIFIARWSGDAARDGDGASAVIVRLKR